MVNPSKVQPVEDPLSSSCPTGHVRFACFSDTHAVHDDIPPENIIPCDVLLHTGDFSSNSGKHDEVKSFARWVLNYPSTHKVVICGNHEVTFQPEFYEKNWQTFHPVKEDAEQAKRLISNTPGIIYLEDSSVKLYGYTLYGSPWTPGHIGHTNWAFNFQRGGPDCHSVWKKIPIETDILMTHGPPKGHGDKIANFERPKENGSLVGCEDLLAEVVERVKPLVHVYGHIHEGYGWSQSDVVDTLFINAGTALTYGTYGTANYGHKPLNKPIVFDLPCLES